MSTNTFKPITQVAEYLADADVQRQPENETMRDVATIVVLADGSTELRVPMGFYGMF